jgi:RNA polymerase sigma-70 factor (ECF subfamily)
MAPCFEASESYARCVQEAARAQLEREVRERCERGDHAGAATALLQGYGPEILSFLMAIHRDPVETEDVFSEVAESVWTGLPRFAWESSARTWAYSVARHVSKTCRRNAARRDRRVVKWTGSDFERVVAQVRTNTSAFLRTERRTRLQALRDSLAEDDRLLLVLRVDRDLSWKELARILSQTDADGAMDAEGLARVAARLRKRFQVLKDKLRAMAAREGLVE